MSNPEDKDFMDFNENIEEYNEYLDTMELYAQEQEWPEDFDVKEIRKAS